MKRVNVFIRRQRIKKLEKWTMRAIVAECFFLAIFPTVAAAAVLFGTVAWVMRMRIDTKFKMRSLPYDAPAALFAFISAISVFMSSARSFELIYNFLAFVGIYGLTYLMIGQNIRTREHVRILVQTLAFSALLVVLWGYFQYIFGIDTADMKWVDPEKFPELRNRVFSTLENPNVLAGYLDVFICLALGVLAKVTGKAQKIAMVIAIIMLAICLGMTYARGAYLTIAIVFVIYGIIQDWRILILFVIVSVSLFYYDSSLIHRLASVFEFTDSSEELRIGIWVSTIAMIADHPFIGIGWGAFKSVYPNYDYYLNGADVLIYHAHNIYLHYAAEVGIIGAMAFFWCFFGTMQMSLQLASNQRFQLFKVNVIAKFNEFVGPKLKNGFSKLSVEFKEKYKAQNDKIDKLLDFKNMLNEKMANASEKLINWISNSPPQNEEEIEESIEQSSKDAETDKPKVSLKKEPKENQIEENNSADSDSELTPSKNIIDSDTSLISDTAMSIADDSKVTVENNEEENIELIVNSSDSDSDTESAKVLQFFVTNKENDSSKSDDDVDKNDEKTDTAEKSEKITEMQETAEKEKTSFTWSEVRKISNQQIVNGVKFGIGLAFISIALNGLTDDLLFNIPTSMLFWILTALAAAIENLPEEEPEPQPVTRRRRKQ